MTNAIISGILFVGVRSIRSAGILVGACCMTGGLFLMLPIMQAMGGGPNDDQTIRSVDTSLLPPPPPPPPPVEEEEEEETPDDEPPEMEADQQLLDLAQLELAMSDAFNSGWSGSGDMAIKLNVQSDRSEDVDELFSMNDLDQRPRCIFQPGPSMTPLLRKKAPGQAVVIFVVNEQGRVADARVQSATDSVFEKPAIAAVRKWKFEPGTRNGKPVQFRMRVAVTF